MPGPTRAEVGGDDHGFLRGRASPARDRSRGVVSFADIFSGCGGMSLGVARAVEDWGGTARLAAAVDFEKPAAAVFADNFGAAGVTVGDVLSLVPPLGSEPASAFERDVGAGGPLSVLVGGPPCQGHSDLNNYTRRDDPKNALYLTMARLAHALKPEAVLIENVQGVTRDRGGVVDATVRALRSSGYHVDAALVDLSSIGVPQQRKRYLVLGTLRPAPSVAELLAPWATERRTLRWAIDDVPPTGTGLAHAVASQSPDNARRLGYLFDNDLYDLPNSERPACHRDKSHSYVSVYGRLRWDQPAPTLTGGFYSMCMGRYVHPSERRTLVAREAARIQFFPDDFRFDAAGSRTALARMIGNAVPMKLTYAITTGLLRAGVVGAHHA